MSLIWGLLFLIVMVVAYFFPVVVAERRGRDGIGMLFLLNLLLGWTVIGWVILLVVAFTGTSKNERDKKDEELQLLRTLVSQNEGARAQRAFPATPSEVPEKTLAELTADPRG
ncbi:MAG TPA: superinfection immunity protein [Lysobacter sp.]